MNWLFEWKHFFYSSFCFIFLFVIFYQARCWHSQLHTSSHRYRVVTAGCVCAIDTIAMLMAVLYDLLCAFHKENNNQQTRQFLGVKANLSIIYRRCPFVSSKQNTFFLCNFLLLLLRSNNRIIVRGEWTHWQNKIVSHAFEMPICVHPWNSGNKLGVKQCKKVKNRKKNKSIEFPFLYIGIESFCILSIAIDFVWVVGPRMVGGGR